MHCFITKGVGECCTKRFRRFSMYVWAPRHLGASRESVDKWRTNADRRAYTRDLYVPPSQSTAESKVAGLLCRFQILPARR